VLDDVAVVVPFTGPHPLTGLDYEALAADGANVGGVDDAGGAGLQPAVPMQMEGMKGILLLMGKSTAGLAPLPIRCDEREGSYVGVGALPLHAMSRRAV
jgi:hypothetical protein